MIEHPLGLPFQLIDDLERYIGIKNLTGRITVECRYLGIQADPAFHILFYPTGKEFGIGGLITLDRRFMIAQYADGIRLDAITKFRKFIDDAIASGRL